REPPLLAGRRLELHGPAEERVVRPQAVGAGSHLARGRLAEEQARPTLGVEGQDHLALLDVVRPVPGHRDSRVSGHRLPSSLDSASGMVPSAAVNTLDPEMEARDRHRIKQMEVMVAEAVRGTAGTPTLVLFTGNDQLGYHAGPL